MQLLYLNYNKKIKEIFSNDESNSQILHNILKNFLECNIIENKIQNNNEVKSQDKKYLKKIIKNYLLFSIHYFYDNYNFDIEIIKNFNFEKYFEMINNNLKELNSKIILFDIKLYINDKIEKSLFNILIFQNYILKMQIIT